MATTNKTLTDDSIENELNLENWNVKNVKYREWVL